MQHNTKDKKQKKADPAAAEATIPVIFSTADLNQNIQVPFRLDEKFAETSISLPVSTGRRGNNLAFIEALKYDTCVKHLTIAPDSWPQQDINALVESLSANRGVTELELNKCSLTPILMEGLVNVLKRNTTIKILNFATPNIALAVWTRFCDGLEYYHFTTLRISEFPLKESFIDIMDKSIGSNQTINTLSFVGVIMGATFENICTLLEGNRMIERLELHHSMPRYTPITKLNSVLKANFLKSIEMINPYLDWPHVAEGFYTNTSLEELTMRGYPFEAKHMRKLLKKNRTLRKLDLSENRILARLDFGGNTTLKELSVLECHGLSLARIAEDLQHNKSLKILTLGNHPVERMLIFERYLKWNTTLEELHIHNIHVRHVQLYAELLTRVIPVNNSLRKLTFNIETLPFDTLKTLLEALKQNVKLTSLNLGPFDKVGKEDWPANIDVEDVILDVLKTNKTLRHITGADYFLSLKRNREAQNLMISNTCSLIQMIVRKPNSFILPIEVWLNVFGYFSYSFAALDFEKFFQNSMAGNNHRKWL